MSKSNNEYNEDIKNDDIINNISSNDYNNNKRINTGINDMPGNDCDNNKRGNVTISDISNNSTKDINKNNQLKKSGVKPKKKKRRSKKSLKNNIIVCIGTIMFMFAGVFLLYLGITNLIVQLNYEEVDAVVISVRTERDEDNNLMATPTYEYYVDGVRYEVESNSSVSANLSPVVGDIVTIKYNPENPEEIATMGWIVILFFILAILFGGTGVTLFTLTITGKIEWVSTTGRRRY